MNLNKLLDMQKVLADRVAKEHPEKPGEKRFSKILLALAVEVGECCNEWKGFKFWKVDPQPTDKLLEEYVDGVHFILDLALLVDYKMPELSFPKGKGDINELFLDVYGDIDDLRHAHKRQKPMILGNLLESYILLGAALGFTWDEIEAAYCSKNAINHTRQDTGY
jgi:dimeric dUTPase (all-alpha-NTP-PPase superfamily)